MKDIKEVINMFKDDSNYMGSTEDKPEGDKYIQISHTLAQNIVKVLENEIGGNK